MPIVQAYKCPRTRKLFEDKDKYVKHLRLLARESFRDGPDDQVRMNVINRKIDNLRKTARSVDDLVDWFHANIKILELLTVRSRSLHAKPKKQAQTINIFNFKDLAFEEFASNERCRPINGVLNRDRDYTKPMHYCAMHGGLHIDTSDGLDLSNVISSYFPIGVTDRYGGFPGSLLKCAFFAEDWPFIGANFLYANRFNELKDRHCRIIQHAFPGISVEYYRTLHSSGLLPDDSVTFSKFMFQYVDTALAVQPGMSAALPDEFTIGDV